MNSTGEIRLYVDAMIIEAIIEDPSLIKSAGAGDAVMGVIHKVKDYFASKIDPNNKTESVLNLLAPGTIGLLFSSMGAPWIGMLLALATQVFKINVGSILTSIYNSVKTVISGGKQTSSREIDAIVDQSVQSNYTPVSNEDESIVLNRLQQSKNSSYDVKQQLRDARTIKLAIISFKEGNIEKTAWIGGLTFVALQGKILLILKTLFGWVFKIALGSAGAIVAGDAIRNFLDKSGPSAGGLLSNLPFIKQRPAQNIPPPYVAKQTKFKINPTYSNRQYNVGNESTWAEGFMNNGAGISDMLVQFTKEVYKGLNGLEGLIKSTETFQEIVREIARFNDSAPGSSVVFLPRMFNSKKQIVDLFIDDVAQKAPNIIY